MKKNYTFLLAFIGLISITGQNLVQNPSFEDGLNNWSAGYISSYTTPILVTNDGHSGTNSVGYERASATTGFNQDVAATPGVTYRLSFWFKSYNDTDSTNKNNARIYSRYKSATGAIIYQNSNPLSFTNDPLRGPLGGYLADTRVWTQYSVDVVAPANVATLQYAVRVYTNGTAFFDDFVWQDVASMGVSDTQILSKTVKMNTSVQNELMLFLPEKCTVNIYSMEGKIIRSERVSNGGTIDTSNFAKGMYIVEVNNGTEKFTQKIVKK